MFTFLALSIIIVLEYSKYIKAVMLVVTVDWKVKLTRTIPLFPKFSQSAAPDSSGVKS